MHPEIAELIKKVFCPNYISDSITFSLKKPLGMPYRIRFFFHNEKEDPSETRSHQT